MWSTACRVISIALAMQCARIVPLRNDARPTSVGMPRPVVVVVAHPEDLDGVFGQDACKGPSAALQVVHEGLPRLVPLHRAGRAQKGCGAPPEGCDDAALIAGAGVGVAREGFGRRDQIAGRTDQREADVLALV